MPARGSQRWVTGSIGLFRYEDIRNENFYDTTYIRKRIDYTFIRSLEAFKRILAYTHFYGFLHHFYNQLARTVRPASWIKLYARLSNIQYRFRSTYKQKFAPFLHLPRHCFCWLRTICRNFQRFLTRLGVELHHLRSNVANFYSNRHKLAKRAKNICLHFSLFAQRSTACFRFFAIRIARGKCVFSPILIVGKQTLFSGS